MKIRREKQLPKIHLWNPIELNCTDEQEDQWAKKRSTAIFPRPCHTLLPSPAKCSIYAITMLWHRVKMMMLGTASNIHSCIHSLLQNATFWQSIRNVSKSSVKGPLPTSPPTTIFFQIWNAKQCLYEHKYRHMFVLLLQSITIGPNSISPIQKWAGDTTMTLTNS